MQPPARGRSPNPSGRGRTPARWTIWEVALITVSALMIAFPLYAGAVSWIMPPLAPAQESTPAATAEPTAEIAATAEPTAELPATAEPTAELPATAEPTAELPATAEPSPTDSVDLAQSPIITTTPLPTRTPSGASPTPSSTITNATATGTSSPTITSTPSVSPTGGASATPTETATSGPSPTASSTATSGPSPTASSTATATVGLSPTPSPTPGSIRAFKAGSVGEAAPGQQISFSISVLTTSSTDVPVTVEDILNANLIPLSASSGSGNCTLGQTISCRLTVRNNLPASVTIQVRIDPNTPSGTTINNTATADGSASNQVSVRVVGSPLPTNTPTGTIIITPVTNTPTSVPSNTPTGTISTATPTSTGQVVNTPTPTSTSQVVNTPTSTTGVVPTPTPTTRRPPPPPRPTEPPPRPRATETPPPPPPPPTPVPAVPTEPPTPPPPPPLPRPSVVRPTAARTAATAVPSSTPAPQVSPGTPTATRLPAPGSAEVSIRMSSDWGSAYPNQEVRFTLVVRNLRPAGSGIVGDVVNLTVRADMPINLDVLGAVADRGPGPTVSGNSVSYTIPRLSAGETVEIAIATRIKTSVAIGTLLVAQGELRYDGLAQPAFSNIVTVLVVGNAQQQAPGTATPTRTGTTPSATATAAAYPPPLGGGAATSAPANTSAPAATSAPAPQPTVAPAPPAAPLPDTSTGVPLMGVLLLGLTLLTRTVRLHRSRDRI